MKKKHDSRIFLTSFYSTLCLLLLLLGFAIVDFECRKVGFGDNKTLIYEITGKNINLSCNTDRICYNYSVFVSNALRG